MVCKTALGLIFDMPTDFKDSVDPIRMRVRRGVFPPFLKHIDLFHENNKIGQSFGEWEVDGL
jgi:hypothetical protein